MIMGSFKSTIRVQTLITIVGLVLLFIKFTAYFITQSVAILTDALESIVNVVAGSITLYSLIVAARPRDTSHPYGHGKAEFISAGIEGTLITLAGIFILIESVRKLLDPSPVHALNTGIWLIGISGLVNLAAGYIAVQTGKKNNSVGVAATGKHLISDAISTAGLVMGLLVLYFTGWLWVDSAIALIMGSIIITTGYKIVRSSIAGIMDEADMDLLEKLVKFLNEHRQPNWIDLHNLRVIKYGNQLHIDCHLTLPWYMNVHETHREVEKLGKLIMGNFGDAIEMFVHIDGCLPFSCRLCGKNDCEARLYPLRERIEWTTNNLFQNRKHELTNSIG